MAVHRTDPEILVGAFIGAVLPAALIVMALYFWGFHP